MLAVVGNLKKKKSPEGKELKYFPQYADTSIK